MRSSSISSLRVVLKYRFKRLVNLLSNGFRRKPSTAAPAQRMPTANKTKRGWVTGLILLALILFSAGGQAFTIIQETIDKLAYSQPELFTKAVILEITFLFFAILCLNLANKQLSAVEWDLEWLATLPISQSKLIRMRIIERTFANGPGLVFLWPFITLLLFQTKMTYGAPIVGYFCTVLLLFFEASIRTIFDTGLRTIVSHSKLRNVQALVSLLGSFCLLMLLSVTRSKNPFFFNWSALSSLDFLRWTPPGLLATALTSHLSSTIAMSVMLLVLEVAMIYGIAYALLLRLLKAGIVSGGTRQGTRILVQHAPYEAQAKATRKSFFSPLQRREGKLLARDRTFMMQTLVLPIFITGMQFAITGTQNWKDVFHGNFSRIAATAFGVAAYSLMFSAFHVLNAEGKSLWILYTFPMRLEKMIRQKVYLWLGLALLYPILLFGVRISLTGLPQYTSIVLMVVVIVGVIIFATVAACLGVLGSDPQSEDPRHRARPDYLYLYMLLAGFYTYAIFANSDWQKLTLVILSALMALALFQKARDHLPYLLDPTESPAASVSLADGLMAALGFFVIQGSITAVIFAIRHTLTAKHMLLAFLTSGALTFFTLRVIYSVKKTIGVPKFFGERLMRGVVIGIACGLGAGLLGIVYLKTIAHYGFFADSVSNVTVYSSGQRWWIFALAILAAPLFEEFIFRGIIFKGLSRTWSFPLAFLGASAIFAIVHPPASIIPVFCLGMFAAFGYMRTGMLLTPIIAHAMYNAIVIFYPT